MSTSLNVQSMALNLILTWRVLVDLGSRCLSVDGLDLGVAMSAEGSTCTRHGLACLTACAWLLITHHGRLLALATCELRQGSRGLSGAQWLKQTFESFKSFISNKTKTWNIYYRHFYNIIIVFMVSRPSFNHIIS